MSVVAQKYLVGFMGLALLASVVTAGYLDSQRRQRENQPPSAAPAQLSPELERGLKVYEQFSCIACHGPGGKGGVHNFNAQTGQEVPALIHVADSYTRPDLIAKIQNGVPVEPKLNPNGPDPPLHMPAFKDLLTDAQMKALVAYLISLKPKGQNLGF
jgi:mono/diheme cytochrome c family protein